MRICSGVPRQIAGLMVAWRHARLVGEGTAGVVGPGADGKQRWIRAADLRPASGSRP